MSLFAYPEPAKFARIIPKSKFHAHAQLRSPAKRGLTSQVEQIIWQYKLAPTTINLPATAAVSEIQIFGVALKHGELDADVLRSIDASIPYPIIFELRYGDAIQVWAAYKRPHASDAERWEVGEYFWSDWHSLHDPRQPLPLAIDLERLYGALIAPLLPYPPHPGERLAQHIERLEQIKQTQRAISRCQKRLQIEQQYNRKVQHHRELQTLNQTLSTLITTTGTR
jgi:hypothetical protein